MRRTTGGWLAGLVRGVMFWVGLAGASETAADDALRQRPMCADAQLNDLSFVDDQHGWAVGDRGTIWHTEDAGRHWQLQQSGVDDRLSSVVFLDQNVGWAAGGHTEPYTHVSRGVVLHTRDGGRSWNVDRKLSLPAVQQMGFFDAQRGWAIGQRSALFPSGVFATSDGGQSWSALPAVASDDWLTGGFVDPHTGALAGRQSALAVIRRRAVEPQSPNFGLRALRQMRLIAPAKGWLVGDGGLVLQTHDLGRSWQVPEGSFPPGMRDHFDFRALAVRGPACWVAGTPGTRVFRTADGGVTWSAGDTGQTLPIRALEFVDARTGWAAGDLGIILITTDGGQTWQRQRGGGTRAAFVGFYGHADHVPLELLARLSADEGYLGTIELLGRQDVEGRPPDAPDEEQRAHEAVVRAGASAAASAWRFPMRQSGLRLSAAQLVDGWNRANDAEALPKLEAHVVARIRMWQPSVVFTSSTDAAGEDPLAHLVNQLVLRSVAAAADPAQYPEQRTQAGLPAWQVQKIYSQLPPGASGTTTVDPSALSARYGKTVGEIAVPARGIVQSELAAPSSLLVFRLLVDRIPQELGRRDFFSGISLSPGVEARRLFEAVADSDLESLHREAQRRRNLQAILAQADEDDPHGGRFLAGIGQQTRTMGDDRAVETLLQLGERYVRNGRWPLAVECYALVVDRYPKHVLAGVALQWLIQYHASGETAWRERRSEGLAAQSVNLLAPRGKTPRVQPTEGAGVRVAAALGPGAGVQQAGGLARDLRASPNERFTRVDNYAKQLSQLQPDVLAQPSVRFPLAVAHRELGLPRQAERYFLGLRHNRPDDAWRACAETELWLNDPKREPPKSRLPCPPAKIKPRLDGQLDEPMWNAGNVVELRSALGDDAQWPAVAMLAYDDEYLYVGLSCQRAESFRYEPSDAPRTHDAPIDRHDRVELLIDVDRDFVTHYRLVIDYRGWPAEDCWGDTSWDPAWYIASGQSDDAWTAEAAIPLTELSGDAPIAGSAWAVGIQRIVPGVGFQSWTTPAAVAAIPEGFGYLLFR